mmetsp:Transcript_3419/g.5039  ORF Transcript_3419/g.5039 Transcript_3419/m.5039 type:complete len:248 (+) Transcript_3419:44-787(+)
MKENTIEWNIKNPSNIVHMNSSEKYKSKRDKISQIEQFAPIIQKQHWNHPSFVHQRIAFFQISDNTNTNCKNKDIPSERIDYVDDTCLNVFKKKIFEFLMTQTRMGLFFFHHPISQSLHIITTLKSMKQTSQALKRKYNNIYLKKIYIKIVNKEKKEQARLILKYDPFIFEKINTFIIMYYEYGFEHAKWYMNHQRTCKKRFPITPIRHSYIIPQTPLSFLPQTPERRNLGGEKEDSMIINNLYCFE